MMRGLTNLKSRHTVGIIGILVMAGLMVAETIPPEVGITIIVTILASLGVYERMGANGSK